MWELIGKQLKDIFKNHWVINGPARGEHICMYMYIYIYIYDKA